MTDKPHGPTSGLTPHLNIPDRRCGEAIDFYVKAFGAEEQVRSAGDDGRLMHAHILVNGASLLLHDDYPEYNGKAMLPPSAVTLHLQVDDADKWYDRAVAAGATATMPLDDMFWGDRYGQLKDPFGHTWSIGATLVK